MASYSHIPASRSNLTRRKNRSSNNRGAEKVDCPILKHDVMHGEKTTCSGCAATHMSELRQHLSRSRHDGFPLFLRRCIRCTTTVVDRASWVNGLHEAGTCECKPAQRESIVTAWARLYLALYPSETLVPNPYTGEHSWLPAAIVSYIRSPHIRFPTNENTTGHHPSTSEFPSRQEANILATNVDNFMPSPAHSESNGSNTPDSPSLPISQEIIDLISVGDDDSRAIEKVQDYLRSQLSIMPVRVYAAIDGYLGVHCNGGGDETDSTYGSMVAESVQSHPHDTDDGRNMTEVDPWSHYNTRLDHASGGIMPTPEEVQVRQFSAQLAESPSPLSLQPFKTMSLKTSTFESPTENKLKNEGKSNVHSHLPPKQSKGELLPIVETCMDATRAKWDLETYKRLWLNFIQRWDRIIEELGSQGSNTARDAFAQVLQSIRARVQLDDDDDVRSFVKYHGQQSHTMHGNQTDATHSSKKRTRNEESSRSAEKGKKRAKVTSGSEEGNRNRLLLDQDDPMDEFEFPHFRCPVQMYHSKHNLPPICEGWAGNQLSQLHHRHLKPPRANRHDGLITIFERCITCKEFVLDQNLWERHQKGDCNWQGKPKRRKRAKDVDNEEEDVLLAVLARIYLTFFPDEQDVPNPYVGQEGDIPRNLTEHFRQQVNATLPPLEAGSFLENQHEETIIPRLQNITLEDIDLAAAGVMLNDFLNPSNLTPYPINTSSVLAPGSTSYDADPGPLVAGSSTMTDLFDFEARLDQASNATISTLEDASSRLNPTAWRILVARAESQFLARLEVLRNTRGLAAALPIGSTVPFSNLHGSSSQPLYLPGQAAASESSTLPSTQTPSTQGLSTNLTSFDDTERAAPTTPPPQTAVLTDSSHYRLRDMGAMDKELDQLARRDTRYATTSLPEAYSDMDSDFDFDFALRGHGDMYEI